MKNRIKYLLDFKFYILLLLLPYIIFTFKHTIYLPGQDEANQIEATLRFIESGSFSFSWVVPVDISNPLFTFQNNWPLGFPVLLFIFLKIFNNLFLTLKIIKIILILINVYNWLLVYESIFINKIKKFFYTNLIVILTLVISQSTTDLISTIFLSYLILYLFRIQIQNKFNYISTLIIGLICGISFYFKYSSVIFLPSIILYILIFDSSSIFEKIKKTSIMSFVFVLIISFIYLYNKTHGEHNFYVFKGFDFSKINNLFYNSWYKDVINSISFSLYSDKLYEIFKLKYFISSQYIFNLIYIFIIISCIVISYKSEKKLKQIVFLTIILYAINIIFLKLLTAFFFDSTYEYRPIIVYRYFWPIAPLMFLLVTNSLMNLKFINNKIALFIFIIISFSILILDVNKKNILYNKIETNYNKVNLCLENNIKNLNQTNFVVFAEKVQWSLFLNKGKCNVFQVTNDLKNIDFNKIKNTVVVVYINDRTDYGLQDSYVTTNLILKDNLKNVNKVNSDITIFWSKFK